jgi:tryptophan synthase alpha chain
MSLITSVFKPNYKALIAYITVGYPDLETTQRAAVTLAHNGGDIIELGIPFSDPLADGATIQKASHRALQQGILRAGGFLSEMC